MGEGGPRASRFARRLALGLIACTSTPVAAPASIAAPTVPAASTGAGSVSPFEYLDGHFLVVKVRVNDTLDTKFILDTGMGVNLVSEKMCQQLGCIPQGEHSGKRMSGQEVKFSLSQLASLALGSHRAAQVPVGLFDFEGRNFGVDPSITGFLSLTYFRHLPFTIDYASRTLIIEDEASLQQRLAAGRATPVRLDEDGPSLDLFMPIQIGEGPTVSVEVDTGSPALTLDERFLAPLGIDPKGSHVRPATGHDETGFTYTRYFPDAPVPVRVMSAPPAERFPVKAMFQKIIYDGLLGDAYLKHFIVTYDLPHARMIFAPLPVK